MEFLPIIYLSYMFIGLYMLFFFVILHLRNKKNLYAYPTLTKKYPLSVITPAYNEEDCIEDTIKAVLSSTYPIKEMIVVNDNSKDNTEKIVRRLMKRYKNLKLITNDKNLGKAGSLNVGIEKAKGELVAVIDSDSYPHKNAIERMIGYFDDEKTGAVTSTILVKYKNTFMRKLQAYEYSLIAWTRKLLGYVDGIWATPGPLAIYRTDVVKKIGGFDTENLTEDIEITWRHVKYGYKIRMCLAARVESIAPKKLMHWVKQRIRWNIGGIQCLGKYKSLIFRKGMLGLFIIPFFAISMFLGLFGLSVFTYLMVRNLLQTYLFSQYTSLAGTDLLVLKDLFITPSVLNFFGLTLFLLGLFFTLVGLGVIGEKRGGLRNIFNILFFQIVYLTVYPVVLVISILKFLKHKLKRQKVGWVTK